MITHQKTKKKSCRNSQRKHEIHNMSSIFNDTINTFFLPDLLGGFFGTWDSQSYLTTGEAKKNIVSYETKCQEARESSVDLQIL